ncbi:hypothetical protein EVAR_5602_1 [Eumeta japonica]|uniref:Uncharacterized protein n=1 Tax=Eumeta variegata TaxID=151549 RepID=A0A4C1U1F3_EUMVA|nr:hypothetical protein EVAR_5602_1 [Eumeta japonica]
MAKRSAGGTAHRVPHDARHLRCSIISLHGDLRKNANAENIEKVSRSRHRNSRNHYMDDYLQSFPTEEAIKIAREVALVHSRAHFNLQNGGRTMSPLNALTSEPRQVDKKLNCGTNEEKCSVLSGDPNQTRWRST